MNPLRLSLLTGTAALLSLVSADAATVSSAGTLVDLTSPGFATGNEAADLDSASAGSDGFVIFNTVAEGTNVSNRPWNESIVDNSPAYITALDGTGSTSSGGWANYDDVTVGGNTYNTGGIVQSPGDTAEAALFTFQLAGVVPSTVTLGLLVDNSDSPNWDVSNVRIEGPGAIGANQDVAINGGTDLVQFDIGGGLAGETYTVFGTSPPAGALIGAVTFDSIPEPGSMALFVTGIAIIFRRRRR
ncbi:MAG: PEP-CTERM sorting domain-containing protein [Verrucomicrobiales bacterium]